MFTGVGYYGGLDAMFELTYIKTHISLYYFIAFLQIVLFLILKLI